MKKCKVKQIVSIRPPRLDGVCCIYKCIKCGWHLNVTGFFRRKYFCWNKDCDRYGLETFVFKDESIKKLF